MEIISKLNGKLLDQFTEQERKEFEKNLLKKFKENGWKAEPLSNKKST